MESTLSFCTVHLSWRRVRIALAVGIHIWLAEQTLPMSARRQKGSPKVPTLWGQSDARFTLGIGVGLDVGLQLTWHCLNLIFRLRLRQPPTAAIATRRCRLLCQLQHLSVSVSASVSVPGSVLERPEARLWQHIKSVRRLQAYSLPWARNCWMLCMKSIWLVWLVARVHMPLGGAWRAPSITTHLSAGIITVARAGLMWHMAEQETYSKLNTVIGKV